MSRKYATMADVLSRLEILSGGVISLSQEEIISRQQEFEDRELKEKEDYEKNLDIKKRELATHLVGATSSYAGIRLKCPKLRQTKCVSYFLSELDKGLRPFYLLLGQTGCGKTMSSVALIAEIACSYHLGYAKAAKLSTMMGYDHKDERNFLETSKYLLIDDIGTEMDGYKGRDFNAWFEYIVDHRTDNRLFTIVTSNLSLEKFSESYGARVSSRIRKYGKIFQSDDLDFRGENNV